MVTSVIRISGSELYEVTFDLGRFEHTGRRMLVAGSFNNWRVSYDQPRIGFAHISVKASRITIRLPAGIYEYKYYDAVRQEWMEIEHRPEIYRGYEWDYCWNVFGTKNCVLRVPPR